MKKNVPKSENFQNYFIQSKIHKFEISNPTDQNTKNPSLYLRLYFFIIFFNYILQHTFIFSSYKNYFQDDRKRIYLTRVLKTPIIEVDFLTN